MGTCSKNIAEGGQYLYSSDFVQMLSYDLLDTIIKPLAHLLQHHIVGIAIQFFKRQSVCIFVVYLAKSL